MALQQITEGKTGQEAANIIYQNDQENATAAANAQSAADTATEIAQDAKDVLDELDVNSIVHLADFESSASGQQIYAVDMGGTVTSGKGNSILVNSDAIAKGGGTLNDFNILTAGAGTIIVRALTRTGNVFSSTATASFQATGAGIASTNSLGLKVNSGQYVGVYIQTTGTADLKYYQTGQPRSYFGGADGGIASEIKGGSICYGFTLNIETKERPAEIEDFANDIKNDTLASIDNFVEKAGIKLYGYDLQNADSDIIHTGWSFSSAGAVPSVTGLGGKLYVNKQINIEDKIQRVDAVLQNNTVLSLLTVGKEETSLQTYTSVNAVDNSINIHQIFVGNTVPAVRSKKTLTSISLSNGGRFIIELYRKPRANGIKITDFLTGVSEYLEVQPTQAVHGSDAEVYAGGLQYDCFGVSWVSGGAPTIKNISAGYYGKLSPLLYITGDSITYGYGTNDITKTYAHLIGDLTGGDFVVSPRGGGRIGGVIEKITTECSIIKPKYVMVTIGTNAAPSVAQIQQLKDLVIGVGAIPIINCIPCRTNGEQATANNNILSLGGCVCRFDLATAINRTATPLKANLALYVDGGVHPNTEGFKEMVKRIPIDIPFLL